MYNDNESWIWVMGVLIIVFIVIPIFGMFFYDGFLGKAYNEIRHENYINSTAHIEGMTDDLAKYKYEYDTASEGEKTIIAATIRQRFAEFDETKIESVNLRNFLMNIRGY